MIFRVAADLTVILHLVFILFVLFGGLFCLHHARWAWLHLSTMSWGVWVEWANRQCPLTPLENYFREMASGQGYSGGFIEQYLLPLIYPGELTSAMRWFLGALVLATNMIVYLYVFKKRRKRSSPVDEHQP